jgi:hypothetical protein
LAPGAGRGGPITGTGAAPHRQQQILVSIFLTGVCIMEITSILLRFFGLVLFGAAGR